MPSSRRAFTIIELIVVLAITALMSAIAIGYASAGRNAIALSIEASKISQFILQAKQLSIATYGIEGPSVSCGFGVEIDAAATPQTYSIFAYSPVTAGTPCPPFESNDPSVTDVKHSQLSPGSNGVEKLYTDGTWRVPVSQGVQIVPPSDNADGMGAVLFYPPTPDVLLSHDGTSFNEPPATEKIYLETVDGKNSMTISVDPEGQVSF